MTNLPTLKSIIEGADLRPLSLETVDALLGKIEAQRAEADLAKKALTGELTRRYGEQFNTAYLREAKDTGTVHVEAEGFDLAADRPKKVEWDQDALAKIGDEIAAAGDDPHEYVKTVYAIDERKYTAWPAFIRDKFADARTVKPGTMTIKLSRLAEVSQ